MRQERPHRRLSSILVMVEPRNFQLNKETAASNSFQDVSSAKLSPDEIAATAKQEFQQLARVIKDAGVEVVVSSSPEGVTTPDSIFPNNWISLHPERTVIYPMQAKNRRQERQADQVIARIEETGHTVSSDVLDLSPYEEQGLFLEGTGSLVLDRENRVAYACVSPRTSVELVKLFCEEMQFSAVVFHSVDQQGKDIYHTNVMMSIGLNYAVVCLESVPDEAERTAIKDSLTQTGKTLVDISYQQLYSFCGNILQVCDSEDRPKIIMSKRAFEAFTPEQIAFFKKENDLVFSDLSTIETYGGGSARCMLAEVF